MLKVWNQKNSIDLIHKLIVIEASYPRIREKNTGKLTKCFFAVGCGSFFSKILRLFSKILSIKLSLKVEIILLRKYNMIFKAKDAGVNRKRKPLTLYYCRSLYGQNKQPTRLQNVYTTPKS